MMGDVIALRVLDGGRRPRIAAMVCLECGIESSASCDCHAPYVPPGKRIENLLAKDWATSNVMIARRANADEATVRRARKRMIASNSAPAELVGSRRLRADGKLQTVREQLAPAKPAKLYKRNTRKGSAKLPVTDKEHLIAFTRELSNFVSDFTIELIKWLDREPSMERAGRAALVHTLDAFSMQLQLLAQRVDGR
jgi:hypothetical protein